MNFCFHSWRVVSKDATGYFEKQEGQGSGFAVPGTVFECRKCPKMILEPTDLKLRTVEVERSEA